MNDPLFFVSYVRAQKSLMKAYITAALDDLSIPYWFDEQLNAIANTDWWQEVSSQISKCSHFALLLTDEWQSSYECKREYMTAQQLGKLIVPVAPYVFEYSAEYAHFKREHQISFVFERDGRKNFTERLEGLRESYLESSDGQSENQPESAIATAEILGDIANSNQVIRILGRGANQDLAKVFCQLTMRYHAAVSDDEFEVDDLLWGELPNQLLIIGGPGSGKSTLLQYLQLKSARSEDPFLSVRISCRGLASKRMTLEEWLANYVRVHFDRELQTFAGKKPEAGIRLLILLDGLDEVAAEDYERISHEIVKLTDSQPSTKVIVTTRPNGFEQTDFDGYVRLALKPLTDLQVRRYIRATLDDSEAEKILAVVDSSERIAELVETPFILALLAASHSEIASDTRKRAQLFSSSMSYLLRSEDWETARPRPSNEEIDYYLSSLKLIALRLFMLESEGIFAESELIQCLSLPEKQLFPPRETLLRLTQGAGLLQQDKDGYFFVHRSIWEYLVAAACLDEPLERIAERSMSRRWEEPIRLYVGLAEDSEVERVIEAIWEHNPSLALRTMNELPHIPALLLERLYSTCDVAEKLRIITDVERLSSKTIDSRESQRLIVDTAEVLSKVEKDAEVIYNLAILLRKVPSAGAKAMLDRIFDASTLEIRFRQFMCDPSYKLEFCHVSAGSFEMGIDEIGGESADASEKPCHLVELDQYYVGRYLVTNKIFYDSFPYGVDRRNEYSSEDLQPVNKVSWYEAALFAWWMGCDLPSDAEWEYMARGEEVDDVVLNDLSKLPEYAWHGANSGNKTHSVGTRLPNSRGVFDVSGNLREWCSDWYSEKYYAECHERGMVRNPQGPNEGDRKVLRGGTFDWAVWNLRPTYRNSNTPDNRNHVTGFRLICRPMHSSFKYIEG